MEQIVPPAAKPRTPRGALFFCGVLMLVGIAFIAISAWRLLRPPEPKAPAHDLAAEAKALLREQHQEPLSAPLAQILAEAENNHFPSYDHPLLGKAAPDFTRPDVDGKPWSLKQALAKGPVVVVFYYGYYCDHCVAQLFGLKEDYDKFRELGAEVVALSADTTEQTREKYKQYGAFPFPVLWDRGNRVAEAYGVFKPAEDGKAEELLHGTFVVAQDGTVTWAAFATTPFGRNDTLLYEIARLTGRVKK
ncbi:MAG: peroxiredoxin family protein [Gemmataceae bacterium]